MEAHEQEATLLRSLASLPESPIGVPARCRWRIPQDALDTAYDRLVDRILCDQAPVRPIQWLRDVEKNLIKKGPHCAGLQRSRFEQVPLELLSGRSAGDTGVSGWGPV